MARAFLPPLTTRTAHEMITYESVCSINPSDRVQECLLCAENCSVSRGRESLGEYSLVHENPDIKTSLRGLGAQTLVIVLMIEK